MFWLAQGSLIVWPAVVLFIFERQSIRRAVVTSFIAAWLFLPPLSIDMSGIPDWTKSTATVFGVLAAVLIKQPQRLLNFRPRWFDLPVLGFCTCPMVSSLSMGVGVYEGLSAVLDEVVRWGLPYLLGRIYLGDTLGARQLALGIAVGGLLYIPFCLAEIRLSPVLKMWVYGFTNINTAEFGMRYGGYRPAVFLSSGLEVGWWMCCATLCAYLMVGSRVSRQFIGMPAKPIAWMLGLVAVACKSTGAIVQLAVGIVLIQTCRLTKTTALFWLLLAIAPTYCLTRSSGYCSGQQITTIAGQIFPADRLESLGFRCMMEDRLIAQGLQHPILGWTRVGGYNPADEQGRTMAITDGYWIIIFCCMGAVGLALLNTMLLLPTALFLKRYPPTSWTRPEVAPLLALATILPLFMIDNLSNAMLNPIYAIAMGVVTTCCDPRRSPGLLDEVAPEQDREAEQVETAIAQQIHLVRVRPNTRNIDVLAQLRTRRARGLADQGQTDQALTERFAAEELWRSIESPASDSGGWSIERSSNANDLAWLLACVQGVASVDLDEARRLIEAALLVRPGQAPFWNTLGLVCYRQGDHHRAIHALSRSVTLSADGGTAFDFYFLALANRALGYHQVATTWLDRAEVWREARPDLMAALEPIRAEAFATET